MTEMKHKQDFMFTYTRMKYTLGIGKGKNLNDEAKIRGNLNFFAVIISWKQRDKCNPF